jgi:UDP-N-acetylmuramoyl-tripeptide--D-alanyl-D-alanine ligase
MIEIKDILKLKGCDYVNPKDGVKHYLRGCSIDSRKVKSGELFIAIKGENHDGHSYLKSVFEKGVSFALVNRNWYRKNKAKFPQNSFFVVEDTVRSLGELANIHRNNFCVPVICIGGSNGKTSTKDMTGWLLKNRYNVLVSEGNYNNHIGLPLTLLKLNKNHEICLLEVGSNHFNEIKYLCEISEPNFGLVTNIGREHLEFFRNINGVAKEELSLFEYLINDTRGNICFANYDDEIIRGYFRNKDKNKITAYSYRYNTEVKGRFKGFDKNFQPEIEISYNRKRFDVKIPTFGFHSIYNGLSATAVALYFGLTGRTIKKAFADFKPLSSKRMEVIRKNGIVIINDTYNSNPDSVKLGLETVNKFSTSGKKHIVLADMLEMGKASKKEHQETGRLIKKMKFDNLYTYGKESYQTFLTAGNIKNNFYFDTQEDMLSLLKSVIGKGDVVYVKGSRGMEMEKIVNNLIK